MEAAIEEIEAKLVGGDSPPKSSPPSPWRVLNSTTWSPIKKSPQKLWLPDNKIKEVTSWAHILSAICEYCLISKPELFDSLPISDKASGDRCLLFAERPDQACAELTIVDRKVYLNKPYSAPDSVANAVYMLEKLGEGTASKAAVLLAD